MLENFAVQRSRTSGQTHKLNEEDGENRCTKHDIKRTNEMCDKDKTITGQRKLRVRMRWHDFVSSIHMKNVLSRYWYEQNANQL